MNRRVFLAGATALAVFGGAAWARESAQAGMERFIARLGSHQFAEREKASRALAKMDSAPIRALRKAARHHADAEVRRRAALLVALFEERHVRERARHIIQGELPDTDNEARLQALLPLGTPLGRVQQVLGPYEAHSVRIVGDTFTMHW